MKVLAPSRAARLAPRVKKLGAGAASAVALACSGNASPLHQLPRVIVPLESAPTPSPKTRPSETEAEDTVRLVPNSDLPDPPAARADRFVEYDFGFERGKLVLISQREKLESQPVLTPRRMGRFAVELFLGPELVERVRFDFPLLGDGSGSALENGLSTQTRVLVPLLSRATRARLLDRKSRQELILQWPPALVEHPTTP